MDTKKEIEGLLNSLKKRGFDRGRIEKDLNYSENYIDQTLSKGGNKRFLNSLRDYANRMLQKAIHEEQRFMVSEPAAEYKKPLKIQTASGKTLSIQPEGSTEIELLNALLEERDLVINTIKEEKQARIDELIQDKERLFNLISSSLGDISKVQQAIFAMVMTLQKHEAVITSQGNKKREAEMLDTLSRLNADNLKIDAKQDNAVVLRR